MKLLHCVISFNIIVKCLIIKLFNYFHEKLRMLNLNYNNYLNVLIIIITFARLLLN